MTRSAPLGQGAWAVFLVDRITGDELPLDRTGWIGSVTRTRNQVSTASIVLDPDYADRLLRRPVLWQNELVFRRDDDLAWVGPVTSINDDAAQGVTWAAEDRMVWAAERRVHWRSQTLTADAEVLFGLVLDAADYGDSTGLARDPRPNGVTTSLAPVAGDPLAESLEVLGDSLEWSVIGDVVRYGNLNISAEATLPSDAWGADRPSLFADGRERLTHVVAVTTNNGRVWYPSADPDDRPDGHPLLIDTIDVGDLSVVQARQTARALFLQRQGELVVVADDNRPAGPDMPLVWEQMVPGAVVGSTVRGRALFAQDAALTLTGVTVDISDGFEQAVVPSFGEAPQADPNDPLLVGLENPGGLSVPADQVFPYQQLALAASADQGGSDRPLADWSTVPLDEGSYWGGDPGPFPPFDPIDWVDLGTPAGVAPGDPTEDPYADCPPEACCDLCSGNGGNGNGGTTPKRIWLASTLDAGDTVWEANDGESRDIFGQALDCLTSPGGIVLAPASIMNLSGFGATADPGGSWNTGGGNIIHTLEISQWWTVPNGRAEHNQLEITAGTMWGAWPIGEWDGSNPTSWAIVDLASPALNDWILVDVSTIGVSGYAKVFVRITQNPVTNLTEVEISSDGLSWTSQGTRTFDTPFSSPKGLTFVWDSSTNPGGDPTDLAPVVIHSASMEQTGGDGPYSFDHATDLSSFVHSFEDRGPNSIDLGDLTWTYAGGFASAFARARGAAPLYAHWVGGITDSTAQAIFDGGDDLVDPAIAVSWAEDPAHIQVVTGVQPNAFTGCDSSFGSAQSDQHALIWAIADRDSFDAGELDANGWPDGWWPFGSTGLA